MLDIKPDASQPVQAVAYGDYCIVGHDITPSLRPDRHLYLLNPTRLDVMFVMLCLEGEATICCDLQRYRITPGTLFLCKPGSIIQADKGRLNRISFLISDERFNKQLNISFKRLLPHYSTLEKLTCMQLGNRQSERIESLLGMLSETIAKDPDSIYYHECVRSLVTAFAYEIISCFAGRIKENTVEAYSTNRQEEYFRQFINLLAENFRQQHRVKFYADAINLTPKYLSSMIADMTGRSPSKWIDEYLLTEARVLLQNTDMNIQEISRILHFPNQSFFGKYFKIHTGMTPSQYRGCSTP